MKKNSSMRSSCFRKFRSSRVPRTEEKSSNEKRDRLGHFTEKQKMHKMSRQNSIRSSNLKTEAGQR